MKNNIAFLLVMLCAASLFIAYPQKAKGQTTDMKVVTYSWYISAQTGNFIVVGELQNTGPNNIGSAIVIGYVFTKDGQIQTNEPLDSHVYASRAGAILPNQKAPFYMEFSPESSTSGNLTWISIGIDRVDFNIYETTTNATPYSGLQIEQDTSYVDQTGNYTVIGVLKNNGEGYPENVWAVATFYNSSGSAIAVGYSNYVTPHFLPPNSSSSFMLIPFDSTPEMANEITSYNLQLLTDGSTAPPALSPSSSASPQPSSSPTTSVAPAQSSSAPASSNREGEPSVPLGYVYAIIAAFVIAIVIIALAFMLRKRTKTGASTDRQ